MILGVPFGTFIAGIFNWRSAFAAAALIAVLPLVLQILFLPSVPAGDKLPPASLLDFIRHIEGRKSVLLILLIFGTHFGTYTFLAPRLAAAGIGQEIVTWSLLGFGITGFIANFVASSYVSKHLINTLAVALLVMAVSLTLMAMSQGTVLLVVGVLLWGAAWGAIPLCLNINNRQASTDQVEAGSAMFTFTAQVAIAAGTAGGGIIVDNLGITENFFSGILFILFSLLILYVWKIKR